MSERYVWVTWVVCQRATVRVVVDERRIVVDTAPLTRVFIGQPFVNLVCWMKRRFGSGNIENIVNRKVDPTPVRLPSGPSKNPARSHE